MKTFIEVNDEKIELIIPFDNEKIIMKVLGVLTDEIHNLKVHGYELYNGLDKIFITPVVSDPNDFSKAFAVLIRYTKDGGQPVQKKLAKFNEDGTFVLYGEV